MDTNCPERSILLIIILLIFVAIFNETNQSKLMFVSNFVVIKTDQNKLLFVFKTVVVLYIYVNT